eukprot:2100989-Prymnesium_polylepis.1
MSMRGLIGSRHPVLWPMVAPGGGVGSRALRGPAVPLARGTCPLSPTHTSSYRHPVICPERDF